MNKQARADSSHVPELFRTVRAHTARLAAPLSAEDMMLQSMEDASPAKWHLAHTTWFFEEFILKPRVPGYSSPDPRFATLFNSYYVQAGPRHARDRRGLISRPGLAEVRGKPSRVEREANVYGMARAARYPEPARRPLPR